ncbi:MAG: hypothetical protein GXO79_15395 [Chlorobi bacterium]|nr:hypothetical protein [Chlorobiota bacterium]
MKTKSLLNKILLVAVLFLSVNFTFAGQEYTSSKKLSNYLKKNISFPYHYKDINERELVIVDFTFTKDGKVIINQINYSNVELKNMVISKLEQLCKEGNKDFCGKSFIYKFKFSNE